MSGPISAEVITTIEASQSMASRQIVKNYQLKESIKNLNEMVLTNLRNDKKFGELEVDKNASQQRLNEQRQKLISNSSELQSLTTDLDAKRRELKDGQLSLFATLTTYQAQGGKNTIVDENGYEYEIVNKYQLKPKK